MSFYTRKDNQTYREGQMPLHYPADRVYLDGDTSKTVQDRFDNLIKTKSISGTTNANGNLSLGLTTDNVVVQVTANGGYPCMPWVYNGEWSVLVGNQSGTSFNTLPNTSVTLKVYYI